MKLYRRHFLGYAAVALPALATAQAGSAWPTHELRIVVGFTAGQSSDISARIVAEELGTVLGQAVIVDNRPGAGATLAHELVAKAAPDGYTLLLGVPGALTMAPSLYPKLRYDPLRDFEPVGMVGTTPYVMVVAPSSPIMTLAELIAAGKGPDGEAMNFGSSGNGSSTHLLMERFKLETGTHFRHIPYKGSVPALTDLMGGRLQVMIDSLTATAPYVKSGKLRALGISTATPIADLPGVPTISSVVPGYEVVAAGLLMVPSATPRPIVDRLVKAVEQAQANPKMAEKLLAQGIFARNDPPDVIKRNLKTETALWAKVVQASGARLD
ncbi:MAG: putative Bug-like extracytoplasmic solute binding receptor, family [Rhizobacter sp.]|nr:putative Bug-like extracytoplasmic solute binding receptor, family [Rhizobacter sp.]